MVKTHQGRMGVTMIITTVMTTATTVTIQWDHTRPLSLAARPKKVKTPVSQSSGQVSSIRRSTVLVTPEVLLPVHSHWLSGYCSSRAFSCFHRPEPFSPSQRALIYRTNTQPFHSHKGKRSAEVCVILLYLQCFSQRLTVGYPNRASHLAME